jgi:glutaminase
MCPLTGLHGEITLQDILEQILEEILRQDDWGEPAQYIPELAGIDRRQFSISVCLADGSMISAGSATTPFSIQSISKVFALVLTLGRVGDELWTRVGREPSGTSFDSVVLLEKERGRPRNPFINAGAIVTTDALVSGRAPEVALDEILGLVRQMSGSDAVSINPAMAESERGTGARNTALAYYLKSHGNLENTPEEALRTYYHQCAIEMTTEQLAMAGRSLAGLEGAPRVATQSHIRRVNALMMTCGHYDGSGDFAFRVGLPGKSGVGGGILVIAPDVASIAIWSPGLNHYGNSAAGTRAAEMLSRMTNWSVF